MNHHPSRPHKFESLMALTLFFLAPMLLGATTGFVYHLLLIGWHATDFLFNAFSAAF